MGFDIFPENHNIIPCCDVNKDTEIKTDDNMRV